MASPHATVPAALPVRHLRRTAVACSTASAVLAALVIAGWHPLLTLDAEVANVLHRTAHTEPGWTRFSRLLSDWFWDPWTMRALLAAAFARLMWQGRRLLAVWVAATAVTATLLQHMLKVALDRERPQWSSPVDSAQYAALPSGHAMTAAFTFAMLLWLLRLHDAPLTVRRTALCAGVVSVTGVGLTRVHLGVHWPSDVAVGWLLGTAVATASAAAWGTRTAAGHPWPTGPVAGRISP